MVTIKNLIESREPYFVRDSATVLEAAEFMAQRNIGAVCVIDEQKRLSGVFSERDLLKRVTVHRKDPATVPITDVMTKPRAVIELTGTPHQALELMERIGSRHLPVVEGERWVGMLSIRDLMRAELGEQGDEIRLLHDYISH